MVPLNPESDNAILNKSLQGNCLIDSLFDGQLVQALIEGSIPSM